MSVELNPVKEGQPVLNLPPVLKFTAQLLSILLHPIFIPVYVTVLVLFVHPLLFAGYDDARKLKLLATIAVNLTFLPAITVFLSWRLGFLPGLHLRTQKERIIPLAAAMIFYFWCWFVLRNFSEIPEVYRDFLFGSFLTIIAAWLANIVYKISLHTLAAGGMVGFAFILAYTVEGGGAWYLAAALMLGGLAGTSRLLISAHNGFEIYSGFLIGIVCQLLAVIL